jgi:DNA-directed RNA polymerase subunit beta'
LATENQEFNAVRISLASPEQIRSWSYGEVTKPETINYRTLRPEKDGLFDEKIFGPTKDFECYCGKYKRVRYRGVVCDKCGVEVTRARVRRERMGHIELAAPVAHIWFVRGTPSRIGLLLHISPRNLERVLYFAQYIVTRVDAQAKERAIADLKRRLDEELARLDESYQGRLAELEQARQEAQAELDSLRQQGADDEALAAHLQQLQKELDDLQARYQEEREKVRHQLEEQIDELEDLTDPVADDQCTFLTDTDYRRLSDKYSGVFEAAMGAEAILDILRRLDLDRLAQKLRREIASSTGQRRKVAIKRLKLVESFRKSGNKPEWMIITVLPVLPPDLRPMVQLDGGRFATSDLNDLYRRVINRNNRLKRLLELGAPEIIVRNEKRMLQEAVDSLIDNGRRGRPVQTAGNHRLKSLSDLLRGKQGRFRQNLLGKRVDYSGRSVIVVGPELKLHQCGLPKRMALELFKPFVMRGLVEKGLAHNIKSAKRMVERVRPEVWDVLEEAVKERPVLLNRAPTLHRLGIQAFEPVLIDGSAIQLHPLVCAAFNADFDGDQMAVHVPLSRRAVAEARQVMLSSHNLLLPANGEPVVIPTLEMVLGIYYLTLEKPGARGEFREGVFPPQGIYSSFAEAKLAYDMGHVELQARILVRDQRTDGQMVTTTIGRILFNEVVPPELGFRNQVMDKKAIKDLVAECYRRLGEAATAEMVDRMKDLGFRYATRSGITIAMNDLKVPEEKARLLEEADARIAEIQSQYEMGLITEEERYQQAVQVWRETSDEMQKLIEQNLSRYGGIYLMAVSGAKGNISQIAQMAGMRGLMSDPSGRIIDLPIRSSFREGLTVLEYFISTHGARKGMADTALRTADSGYLTRRLVDVAQDVIVLEEDCGTTQGIWLGYPSPERLAIQSMRDRIVGRLAAADVVDAETGEVLAVRGQEIDEEAAQRIEQASAIVVLGRRLEGQEKQVYVRSPLSCQAKRGICAKCYGRDLARGRLVATGEAVGIIAAQSIGEPGTQLTMRTFHTGGVAGEDITTGLPRVEELFEARVPRGAAAMAEIDGVLEVEDRGDHRLLRVVSTEIYREEYALPEGMQVLVSEGQQVEAGQLLARLPEGSDGDGLPAPLQSEVVARSSGVVEQVAPDRISVTYEERDQREYLVPRTARLKVQPGEYVRAGQPLTDGPLNPQDILRVQGPEAVQAYLVEEIQKVYSSQGVNINDKHIEVIIRQMLRRVRVEHPGDTDFLPGDLVDRFKFEDENAKVMAEGGEPATAQPVLLGITKAALHTDSFLAAASFQETTRVLTDAAIEGKVDHLLGLKENVIIGRLIPARAPIVVEEPPAEKPAPRPALWSSEVEEDVAATFFGPEEEEEEEEEEEPEEE